MIISCTIDKSYIRLCTVLLKSLSAANPDENISVYFLHGAIDSDERAKLAAYLGGFHSSVSLIQLDQELPGGFPVFGHFSVATYFRLLLPAALPRALGRVIYPDSDMIVVDSLRERWETQLGNYCIGAIAEHNHAFNRKRLCLSGKSLVFNAGVMLINLDGWREMNIFTSGLDFVRNHPERIKYWNQDVLNSLLEGSWLQLNWRWNALPHLWLNPEYADPAAPDGRQAKAPRGRPAVIHFAGSGVAKPWNHRCTHPWRQHYREFKQSTPWPHLPLDEAPGYTAPKGLHSLRFRIKHTAKTMLQKLKA
jgi:lipopolysaccharide biosynthesis glycosyltransferase